MKTCFVVGTDTGVGKTTIAAAVVAAARARGLCAVGMKPVESGCEVVGDSLVPQDAERLARAGGDGIELARLCLYRFRDPVAPGVAAEAEGVEIDFEVIAAAVQELLRQQPDLDLLVVEGAGGLLVPLGANRTVADLVAKLGFPVLVVARAGLGTINHTLLTIEALRSRKLPIVATVLVATEPAAPSFIASNVEEIERAASIRVAGALPHQPRFDGTEATRWVDGHLLDQLL